MLKLRVKQVTYESKIINNTTRPKSKKKSVRDLKNLGILLENSAEGLGSRRALLESPVYL